MFLQCVDSNSALDHEQREKTIPTEVQSHQAGVVVNKQTELFDQQTE